MMYTIQNLLNVSLEKLQYFAAWLVNHQNAVTGVAIAAFVLLHGVLILWLLRRVGRLVNEADRVRSLAEGMALLTDTTESGLTALIREVERLSAKPVPAPARISRRSVAKRVIAAVEEGNGIAQIAGQEALSESEVRLHLMLAKAQDRQTEATKATA